MWGGRSQQQQVAYIDVDHRCLFSTGSREAMTKQKQLYMYETPIAFSSSHVGLYVLRYVHI